ncbi:MAG TPA: hypothetical protein VIJ29_02915 [Candidatus Paceibacterota bacterium]
MKIVIFIIIVIVAVGVGLYLYNSGALVKGATGFNALFSSHPNSTSTASSSSVSTTTATPSSFWSFLGFLGFNSPPAGPSFPPPQGQSYIGPPSGTAATTTINPADIPAGYTAAQLSPYFGDVTIGGASAATFYNYGTITLYDNNYNSTSTIDVTGWEIKSDIGDGLVPQAVNLYDPTGFAPASDILLKTGDTVYLYSSSAPFNLRLNECSGYMAKVANFVPAIPLTCPYLGQSELQNLSGQCQQFIQSIGTCQQPNFSSPQIPQTDYACMQYLENNFTYRSCFDQHSGDANFLSNQVWVWTGDNIVGQYTNKILLFDQNGLLVNVYGY